MTKPQQALNYTEALHLMDLRSELTSVITIADNSRTCIQFILPVSGQSQQIFCGRLGKQVCKKAIIQALGDLFEGTLTRKDLVVYSFYLPPDFWKQYFVAQRLLQLIEEMNQYPLGQVDASIQSRFLACQQQTRSLGLAPELLALPTATGETLGEYLK